MPFLLSGAAFFVLGTISGTKAIFKMVKDHNGNRPYKRAVLRDRGGDLSKEWYVEFYAWDEVSQDLTRKRIKISKAFHTQKSRIEEGNKIISDTNEFLEKGFHFKRATVEPGASILVGTNNDLVLALENLLIVLAPTLRPKTVVGYRSSINKFKTYGDGSSFDINSFSERNAVQFRDYLLATVGNVSRTANNTLNQLAVLYSHLASRVDLPDNPFKIKKLKQTTSERNIAISDPDRQLIEEYIRAHDAGLFLFTRFIYYTFIRPGELRLIRINDLRMNEKYLFVKGEISKNGTSDTLPLIQPILNELSNFDFRAYSADLLLFSGNLKPGLNVIGKQVAFRRHEKILKTLKLDNKGYTLYSWKHTGAVNAYLSGVGIKQLQRLLRHSSVQITDIYLKSLGLRTDPNIESYNW